MKKQLLVFILLTTLVGASFSPITSSAFELENNEYEDITISFQTKGDINQINYQINDFNIVPIRIERRDYNKITLEDESQINKKGAPDLPNICRSIIIPDDKEMGVKVTSVKYEELKDILIAPSKGILPRTINPKDIPYEFGEDYKKDTWYPRDLVILRDPYIVRDYRGQVVEINPFQYNPVRRTLRIIKDITVEVFPAGSGKINVLKRNEPLTKIDSAFLPVYKNHFLNYEKETLYTPVEEQGNMLVICYDNFYDTMVPFVKWKNMKGIPTEIVNLSTIGSTSSDIDAYIENYYNTNGLTFVLLVGDSDQMPSSTAGYYTSDVSYAYILGSDSYPELFIGRFSAQNTADLETQVNRTIDYEKNPQAGADWYHTGIGIGSPEGTGDDGEYDWEHIRNIRTDLLNYTYTNVSELYGQSQGGDDAPGDPSPALISSEINNGSSIINYCGHGSWSSWGWNQPQSHTALTISDVNSLVNDNMLPYVICVACSNGVFDDYDECFCEAWMRATNDNTGEPAGAIVCTGSTKSMSWSPPMSAQDEMNDILVESYSNNIKHTVGGIHFNGCMLMNDEYGSSGYTETDCWHIFGDPSIEIRTDSPTSLSVQHDSTLTDGATEFEINAGIEDALCAISHNGLLLGYNYSESNGDAYIQFDNPVEDIDNVDLVVTAYNKMPYVINLPVTPPVRQPAEFEPMDKALIRYPFGIPFDIIAEMSEDVEVVTIVEDAGEQTTVESQYQTNGVDLNNCSFLYAPTDSYWTRDYGPWFRFNYTTSKIEVVDFEYNRPRPNDNAIPNEYAIYQGLNYTYMDIIHAGGNYMTDGKGTSVSTTLVYSENPSMTPDEINQTVRNYLGIRDYHVLPDVLGEYIEHIDCWAKYLSPDTIMIIEVPPSHSQYTEIENAVDYFENQISCYDTPYDIVRVYTPNGEPYINSLILNDKVFVPQTGSQWDDEAIDSYETSMSGYEVLGFDALVSHPWETTDAIHCRIKGIPDEDMIYINHDPLNNQMPVDPGFYVEAELIEYDTSRAVTSANLYWMNSTAGVWNSVPMTLDGDNVYSAYIPIHPCGETLSYYISAESSSGEIYKDPFIGADDPFKFNVTLVPDIWVDPSSLSFFGTDGMQLTDILTIGNHEFAGEELNFDITVTDGSGLGWLSVNITNGILQPATSIDITVTADTTGLNVGSYDEQIKITSDDPDEPMITIPVDLTVVLGNDVGAFDINSPCGQQIPGNFIVNATIKNYGIYDQNNVLVNCTILEGGGELTEDFEDSDGGYTHSDGPGPGSIDDWEWGVPTYGPTSAHSGSNVWATNLDGDHSNSADSILDSTEVDLNMFAPEPELKFWHWYDHTTYDCGNVKISTDGGNTWNLIYPDGGYPGTATSGNQGIPNEPAFTDVSNGWEEVTFDLSAYAGENVKIRWHFGSTSTTTHPGWYIDDVTFKSGITREPGDIVYTSEQTISVPANSNKFIEFTPQWQVSDLGFYAIQISTNLTGDQDTSNDQVIGIVEIAQAPAGHIATLQENWNFISLPFNQTVLKQNLIINYQGNDYTFNEAVNNGYISSVIFGWDRDIQSYELVDVDELSPGEGYWMFSYVTCELKAPVFEINYDGYITTMLSGWNIIGHPNNVIANKTDITIRWQGIDYSWSEAVVQEIISNALFGWDDDAQSYILSESLEPGEAYWMFSYKDNVMLKTGRIYDDQIKIKTRRMIPPPAP